MLSLSSEVTPEFSAKGHVPLGFITMRLQNAF
jgi:hypothetical protein